MWGGAAIAAVLLAVPAQAAPVIDFQTGGAGVGGTIFWDGTNVVGSNIPIGLVNISGADQNNGSFVVSGLVAAQNGSSFGDLDFNTSSDNNFITLSGCISGLGIGGFDASGSCVAPMPLLTGTFTSYTDSNRGLITGSGTDTKNQLLLDAIGFDDSSLPWEFFGFSVTDSSGHGSGWHRHRHQHRHHQCADSRTGNDDAARHRPAGRLSGPPPPGVTERVLPNR